MEESCLLAENLTLNASLEECESIELLTAACSALIVIVAFVAMLVNIIVFLSVYWIRKPLTPLLRISISLAAADVLSSSIFAATFFINTYLPIVQIHLGFWQVIMEMLKLSGILVTVTHLLLLSLNHYIGILKPLHYNAIVTRRKVTAITIALWLFPTFYVLGLITILGDFHSLLNADTITFYSTFTFRISYSLYFFISVLLISICYGHILVLIKQQQNLWKTCARAGSTKWSGRRKGKELKPTRGNIRAIYTTLWILGSCIIGWMPGLIVFVVMCDDCYIDHGQLQDMMRKPSLILFMSIRCVENVLIVLKLLANPIIYSIRMKEIQEGIKQIRALLVKCLCPFRNDQNEYQFPGRCSRNQHYSSGRIRLTGTTANLPQTHTGGADVNTQV